METRATFGGGPHPYRTWAGWLDPADVPTSADVVLGDGAVPSFDVSVIDAPAGDLALE